MENIERIEKKVNLLYKILLELEVSDIGHPYNQKYINKFMDELIPLFGLSAVEVDIDIPSFQKEKELKSKIETELSRLERIYESGDFLAKDKDKIENKINDIKSCLREWYTVINEGIISLKEDLIKKNRSLYEENLFLNLREKLGLLYEKSYMTKALIKEMDTIKKDLKSTIEKIYYLGDTKI